MSDLAPETQRDKASPRTISSAIGRGVIVLFLVVVAVNLILAMRSPGRGGGKIAPSQPAPLFSGTRLDGQTLALADLRGKVVLLDFWASWCGPCITEMPVLEQVQRKLAGSGRPFTIIGINEEGGAPREAIARLVADKQLSFPILLDDGTIAGQYGVQTIPFLVLIDAQGTVREIIDGGASERELERKITELF